MGLGNGGPCDSAHMPYLRAIWSAPLDPRPLLTYADWLETIGLAGAAAHYRAKAAAVASGRLQPDYDARSWLDDYWD